MSIIRNSFIKTGMMKASSSKGFFWFTQQLNGWVQKTRFYTTLEKRMATPIVKDNFPVQKNNHTILLKKLGQLATNPTSN